MHPQVSKTVIFTDVHRPEDNWCMNGRTETRDDKRGETVTQWLYCSLYSHSSRGSILKRTLGSYLSGSKVEVVLKSESCPWEKVLMCLMFNGFTQMYVNASTVQLIIGLPDYHLDNQHLTIRVGVFLLISKQRIYRLKWTKINERVLKYNPPKHMGSGSTETENRDKSSMSKWSWTAPHE